MLYKVITRPTNTPELKAETNPVIEAVHRFDNVRLEELLQNGADPNDTDSRDISLLMLVVGSSQYGSDDSLAEITKLLIERGADVNAKDNGRRTVLMWAAGTYTDFYDIKAHYTPYNPDIIQMLVDNGANIKARDDDGRDALLFFYGAEGNSRTNSEFDDLAQTEEYKEDSKRIRQLLGAG